MSRARVAQRLELRQRGDGGALVDEAVPDMAERPLQLGRRRSASCGVFLELREWWR